MEFGEILVTLVGAINVIGFLYLAFRKYPFESRAMDATAARGFAEASKLSEEAAKMSATRAETSRVELEAYRTGVESKIKELEGKIRSLEIGMAERDLVIEDLQDWAERLVYQVKSLGGEPVKIRKRKNSKEAEVGK